MHTPLANLTALDGDDLPAPMMAKMTKDEFHLSSNDTLAMKLRTGWRRVFESGHSRSPAVRARSWIDSHDSLKSFSEIYPWFYDLIKSILENKMQFSTPTHTSAEGVTNVDAEKMGRNLNVFMLTCVSPEHAIEEWRIQNPAIEQIMMEYAWFRNSMVSDPPRARQKSARAKRAQ
jgi:hypothetical protein